MLECGIEPGLLIVVLQEIEAEIRADGVCHEKKAMLFHELGSIHGLMGDEEQQKAAWQQAQKLDPDNKIINASLKSLE